MIKLPASELESFTDQLGVSGIYYIHACSTINVDSSLNAKGEIKRAFDERGHDILYIGKA